MAPRKITPAPKKTPAATKKTPVATKKTPAATKKTPAATKKTPAAKKTSVATAAKSPAAPKMTSRTLHLASSTSIEDREPLGGVELQQVLSAMHLPSAHYASCPGGHIYAIGDCGQPTQIALCPELGCGLPIGGEDELLSSNSSAATAVAPLNKLEDLIQEERDSRSVLLGQYRLRAEVEFVLDVFAESLHRGEEEVMDIFGPDFRHHERRACVEASLFRDLLLPGDLSTTTLEARRQQWLEAAPNLSLTAQAVLLTAFLGLVIKLSGGLLVPQDDPSSVLARENVAAYLALLLQLADLMAATTFLLGQLRDIVYGNPRDPRARMVAHIRQLIYQMETGN